MKSRKKYYRIRNSLGDYWSNKFGWVVLSDNVFNEYSYQIPYSIFTKKEKESFNLPVECKWEEIKNQIVLKIGA